MMAMPWCASPTVLIRLRAMRVPRFPQSSSPAVRSERARGSPILLVVSAAMLIGMCV